MMETKITSASARMSSEYNTSGVQYINNFPDINILLYIHLPKGAIEKQNSFFLRKC